MERARPLSSSAAVAPSLFRERLEIVDAIGEHRLSKLRKSHDAGVECGALLGLICQTLESLQSCQQYS